MKRGALFAAAIAATFGVSSTATAQEAQEEEPAYWYVSHYRVSWAKIDSLTSFVRNDEELIGEGISRGNFLEAKVLVHHTGDEWNVVFMTKYPSWEAIDADPGLGPLAEEMWGAERRQARSDAFDYLTQEAGGAHRDYIYQEMAAAP